MKFIASRLSEGNKIFPAEIHIEQTGLTVKIPGLFSGQSKHLDYQQIGEVSVDTPLIGFSTITFFTAGTRVSAHGFLSDEIKQIKNAIDNGRKISTSNFRSEHEQIEVKRKIKENHVEKETEKDIKNLAIKKELELELKYKAFELEREERNKQRIETEELLKSKNTFTYYAKWVWLVLLNKAWKKILFSIIILLFANWAINTLSDKINFKDDENKIKTEIQRLETTRKNIDNLIELKKVDEAEIALVDLVWRFKTNNNYLKEQNNSELLKWADIKLTYSSKIMELQDSIRNEKKKAKKKS